MERSKRTRFSSAVRKLECLRPVEKAYIVQEDLLRSKIPARDIELTGKNETITGAKFDFRDEIIEAASKIFRRDHMERLRTCLQCGKCVGSCPSGRMTSWRIRRFLQEATLGLRDNVCSDENLWNCTTCYTCQERCPHGIPTTDIVRVIRNLAVRSGHMKEKHKKVCQMFLTHGHAIATSDEIRNIRKRYGLRELPPTVLSHPEQLKEVLNILEKTGFKIMVEGSGK
jgi:heterodisulfide reductase subunit C